MPDHGSQPARGRTGTKSTANFQGARGAKGGAQGGAIIPEFEKYAP